MTEHDDEWGPEERLAWRSLPTAAMPPRGADDRVVVALRGRGLLRRRGGRRPAPAYLAGGIAASLALFAAGFALGRSARSTRDAEASPRFALFLLHGREPAAASSGEETARVEETRRWLRGLAARGRSVRGEKLEDDGRLVPPDERPAPATEGAPEILGFFVVSASDLSDAQAVARTCPHVRRGGRILVRPIAPT